MKKFTVTIIVLITFLLCVFASFYAYKNYFSKNNPKVSVLVIIYNRKNYIEECLNSILDQDIDKEIILMDDYSTDGTWELLLELKKRHPELKLFRNKKNLGTLLNRYSALLHANGEYILFVDADDKLFSQALPKIYERAVSQNADIVEFGLEADSGYKIVNKNKKIEKKNILKEYAKRNISNFIVNKLISKKVYQKVIKKINPDFGNEKFSDAVYYVHHFLLNADNVFQTDIMGYFYYNYRGICANSSNLEIFKYHCDFYKVRKELLRVYKEIEGFDATLEIVRKQAVQAYLKLSPEEQEQNKAELYKIMTQKQFDDEVKKLKDDAVEKYLSFTPEEQKKQKNNLYKLFTADEVEALISKAQK